MGNKTVRSRLHIITAIHTCLSINTNCDWMSEMLDSPVRLSWPAAEAERPPDRCSFRVYMKMRKLFSLLRTSKELITVGEIEGPNDPKGWGKCTPGRTHDKLVQSEGQEGALNQGWGLAPGTRVWWPLAFAHASGPGPTQSRDIVLSSCRPTIRKRNLQGSVQRGLGQAKAEAMLVHLRGVTFPSTHYGTKALDRAGALAYAGVISVERGRDEVGLFTDLPVGERVVVLHLCFGAWLLTVVKQVRVSTIFNQKQYWTIPSFSEELLL